METLQQRICHEMANKKMLQNDLYTDPKYSSKISQLVNGKVNDPRLSTLVMIADALDVSLDYLAGRTDNPSGFTPEELEGLRIDAETRALLRDYDRLTPDGRETIREQVDFQLSKSMRDTVPEAVVA